MVTAEEGKDSDFIPLMRCIDFAMFLSQPLRFRRSAFTAIALIFDMFWNLNGLFFDKDALGKT